MKDLERFRIIVKMGLARKQLKQYELAHKLGKNANYLSQVLHGIAPLSDDLRQRIMDELDLNPYAEGL